MRTLALVTAIDGDADGWRNDAFHVDDPKFKVGPPVFVGAEAPLPKVL